MAQNSNTRGSDEPENRREGRSPKAERNRNDEEGRVQLRCCRAPACNLEIIALQLADAVHTANDEEDDEEEQQIGEQAVDAEHHKDSRVVAGEVTEVEVDPALGFAEAGRLGHALEVEELGDGSKVGKSRGDGL